MENQREQEAQDPPARADHTITFESAHQVYGMAISSDGGVHGKCLIALGSFIEDYTNKIDIVVFDDGERQSLSLVPQLTLDHAYPPTKLMFSPVSPCLLASSGDFLRLWDVSGTDGRLVTVLNNSKTTEFYAPLTAFDWNEAEPRKIGACSVDTTCTVWDVERGVVETQLIAHDKEVYDIAWGEARVFASVSADGSVRLFDLRDKEHSTIIYESPRPVTPLLRLAWNKQDLRYMATTLMDSNKVVILDIRSPVAPVAQLDCHRAPVNAISWSPRSCRHICSAGDDSLALIWDLPTISRPSSIDPTFVFAAASEINQLQWSSSLADWIAIAFDNKLQLLRV